MGLKKYISGNFLVQLLEMVILAVSTIFQQDILISDRFCARGTIVPCPRLSSLSV